MAIIRKYSPQQNLSKFGVFLNDTSPNSEYFGITELGENLTGGKNGFLIQGSECLKESTDIRVEILDVQGNPVYFEPGRGEPEYYEGISKLVSVIVYDDTPIGIGKITILGELKSYFDVNGNKVNVPEEWEGVYNVKWERNININRNLPNESRVRFTRRPQVQINELVKPIFDKTIPTKTQSGSLQGEPFLPPAGQKLSDYGGEILYKLIRNTGDGFQFAMDDNEISIPSLTYNPTVVEVLNDSEVLVNIPYTSSAGEVIDFAESSYTSSFEDVLNTTTSASSLTGSFAEIKLTNLKTFVGDVARLKVFRKSRSEAGDFKMVQEIKLESSELLRDFTTDEDTELSYGVFDSYNLSNYWITSSNSPVTRNNTELLNSIKIDYSGTGTQLVFTSQSIDIGNDIEYNLSFKAKLSGSIDESKKIRAYLSGSDFTQSLGVVSGSSDTLQRFNYSNNTLSLNSGSAQLVFEVNGDDWYISNVSFRHAEETSFSPDEFTFLQDVPRKLTPESFEFKFEFYDINNNFIPVIVEKTKSFDGGNLNDSDSTLQLAEVNSKINRLNAETASINLSITSIENTTASFDSSIESLNLTSESLNLQTASLLIGIDNAVESGSVSASNAVTSGSSFASDAVTSGSLFAGNAVESGSVSASNAVDSGSSFAADAVQSGSDFADNAVLSGSESANAAAASASVVSPGSGLIHRPTTPTGTGLFLSKENLGHYDSGEWKTYMSSSGAFYLTGSASNYLQWDGSSLTIRGDITIASGETADQLSALNSYTSSNDSSINNLNSATSSLQDGIDGINATTGGLENPSQYSFGPDALFDLASFSTPSTAGLYLGSTNMGYYNSGWKTYMDSSGNFYLTGSASNYLVWNGSSLQIKGDITIASGETADQLNALNSYTSSNDSSINNLNSTTSSLSDSVSNLNTTTSSLNDSVSNLNSTTESLQTEVDGISAVTTSLENPSSYDFGPGGSNSTFDLSSAPGTPSVTGLYLGSTNLGYYKAGAGAGWKTYMDSSGNFYLGGTAGALQWNGSTLSIEGNVNITGGATANQLSNLNSTTASLNDSVTNLNSTTSSLQTSASDAINDASTALSTANTAQDGVDGINATTGALENPSNYSFGPSAAFPLTTFTPSGAGLYLGQTNMGYYSSGEWKTFMSSSGDFFLNGDDGFLQWTSVSSSLLIKGRVSGSSLEGGTIVGSTLSIPDASTPKFSVDIDGNMSCQDAIISGSINVDDGKIGLWEVIDSASGGQLRDSNSELVLDPTVPELLFNTGSETKLRLKPANEWTNTSGGNISISGMDTNVGSPTTPASSGSSSNRVYGPYLSETNTSNTYTVDQTGTYGLSSVEQPYNFKLNAPSSVSAGTTSYPNYTPSGQIFGYHGGGGSPRVSYLEFYLEAENQETNEVTRTLVKSVSHRGAYTTAPTYTWTEDSLNPGNYYWQYSSGTTYSAIDTSYTANAATIDSLTMTLSEGSYKFRWAVRVNTQSGYKANTDSSGTTTYAYQTNTPSINSYSLSSFAHATATVVIPSNVVELTSKGLQVLGNSDEYLQIRRFDGAIGSSPREIFKSYGGKVSIYQGSFDTDDTMLNVVGGVSFSRFNSSLYLRYGLYASSSVYVGSSNGNSTAHLYVNGNIYANRNQSGNTGRDIGTTSKYFDDVYADDFRNQSDERIKEYISGSDLGLDFINDLRPVKYNKINSKSGRTEYGFIAQEVSSSLLSVGKTTNDFKGITTGSSLISSIESEHSGSITDIILSGSYHVDSSDTGSELITQEWVDNELSSSIMSLSYNQFIAPMVKAIQELSAKVTELENQISGSE